jgi:hypothetical protein
MSWKASLALVMVMVIVMVIVKEIEKLIAIAKMIVKVLSIAILIFIVTLIMIAIMTMIAIPDSYAVLICKRAPILPVPRRQTADVRAVVVITEGGEVLPTIVSIAEGNL